MDDVVTFLNARLDEDGAYARNAFGDHNAAVPGWHEQWSGAVNIGDTEDLIDTNDSQVSRFIARYDPARALREVEAKRAIIRRCERQAEKSDNPASANALEEDRTWALWPVMFELAAVYADHPDYRQKWAP